jgi:hypothetical protein
MKEMEELGPNGVYRRSHRIYYTLPDGRRRALALFQRQQVELRANAKSG